MAEKEPMETMENQEIVNEAMQEEALKDNVNNSAQEELVEDESDDSTEEHDDDQKKSRKKKKEKKVDPRDAEIEELKSKLSESNNKYLRLSAEFDNYRKRTLKEKSDIFKTASGDVLKDFLPVIDDFERGLQQMEKASDVSAVKEGVDLIYNKFRDLIANKGIKEIQAMHQDFDTDLHEALTKIPAPSEDLKGKVVDVIQKGYIIEDKVIRFAKVVIGE